MKAQGPKKVEIVMTVYRTFEVPTDTDPDEFINHELDHWRKEPDWFLWGLPLEEIDWRGAQL